MDVIGYSGKQAAEIVGITYRQLDYWARTDLVRPSLADAKGSGSRRRYSYRDLLELKVIKTLLDAGIKLESVRGAFSYLRENLGEDIASAQLVISGSSAVLVRDGAELIDVVNRYQGQGVLNLNILALENVKGELDAKVHELVPDQMAGAAPPQPSPSPSRRAAAR
ncbi:MAG: MerR family transcriptional regulator [Actinobacteria bacterium]|nr:MerR family transcriptional regulator [Actinomycetota bacterium]